MSKQKDRESEIKELKTLIKEAGAKAKERKQKTMSSHFEQIKSIVAKATTPQISSSQSPRQTPSQHKTQTS